MIYLVDKGWNLFFFWVAVANKVSAIVNLRRMGMISDAISNLFSFCDRLAETVERLFLQYDFLLWFGPFSPSAVMFGVFLSLAEVFFYVVEPFSFLWVWCFLVASYPLCCSMVSVENDRIFEGTSMSVDDLLPLIIARVANRASSKEHF